MANINANINVNDNVNDNVNYDLIVVSSYVSSKKIDSSYEY